MKNAAIAFLKYPEPGNVKTRLAADLGDDVACGLYRAIAERVITEIYPLSGSYHLRLAFDTTHAVSSYQAWLGDSWDFQPQATGSLGDRLASAVAAAFDDGFERVMLLGSDCVGMDEEFIQQAFAGLDGHDVVIGPSEDGGYYLLAIDQPRPWLFEDMPWSSADVLTTTLDRIENRDLKAFLLEEKIDIDTLDDLVKFREQASEHHFLSKKIDQLVLERLAAPNDLLKNI